MLSRSRAMRLIGLALPPSALFLVALGVLLGISLARANDHRVAEIVLIPSGSHGVPFAMSPGGTTDFTVRVLTNGAEVTTASISLRFDTGDLEVVDALAAAGVQILPHPNNPLSQFIVENAADNTAGTILFTAGSSQATSEDFDLAVITLRARDTATLRGDPTEVLFLVNNGDETAVSKAGAQLLAATQDFTGTWISIGLAEIVVLPTGDPKDPSDLGSGQEADYLVRVLTHGAELTAASLAASFDPNRLEVVDALAAAGVQIQPHPNNPLSQFIVENEADNAAGTIRYTVGSTTPAGQDFDLAIVTFRGRGDPTPPGQPTEVVFRVNNGDETALTRSGQQLLSPTEDFVGASINIVIRRLVEIVMLPETTRQAPQAVEEGDTTAFTIQVRAGDQEVTAASLSMTFDTAFLEVGDALGAPGVQIQPHPDNPLSQFTVENEADNAAGTILYTVGSTTPASGNFNIAIITFRAKNNPTPQGDPTEVVFLVNNGDETAVTKSGNQLLANTQDFTGAWVAVEAIRVWTGDLTVSAVDVNQAPISGQLNLVFGVHPDATDGFDPGAGLDVMAPPPAPPPFIFPRFLYPGNPAGPFDARNLQTSIIPPGESREWPLNVDLDSGAGDPFDVTVTVAWDLSRIPADRDVLLLNSDRTAVLADMRAVAQYQFDLVDIPPFGISEEMFWVRVALPPPPTPIRPATGDLINNNRPDFEWEVLSTHNVAGYRLQATRGNIDAGPYDLDEIITGAGNTQFQPAAGPLPDGVYRWRVASLKAGDDFLTGFSDPITFEIDTTPPGAPPLVAPSDGTILDTSTPFFDWDDSTGDVDRYRLLVTSGDIQNGPFDIDVVLNPATEYQVSPEDSLRPGDYNWRVVALDLLANSASSVVRSFTIPAPVPPGEPVLVAPEDGALLPNGEVLFDWESSTGDMGGMRDYTLQVTTGETFNPHLALEVVVHHTITDYQVPAQDSLPDDGYKWRVIATSNEELTRTSVVRSFTVNAERDWESSLNVGATIGGEPVAGGIVLNFGTTPGATDGFDLGIDGVAPIAPPAPPYIQPHFFYPDNPGGTPDTRLLQTSLIESGDSLSWPLRVVANASPSLTLDVTVQWDVSSVPSGFTQVGLFDSDGQQVADMKTTNQYQFSLTTVGIPNFPGVGFGGAEFTVRVSKFQTLVIDFKRGWNLVSLSVEPVDKSPAQVLKDIGDFSIFGFNPDSQGYFVPVEMQAGEGYWVAVFADATQTVQGAPVPSFARSAAKGWNLIGSIAVDGEVELVSGGPLGLSLFQFDANTQGYVTTTTVTPGLGHWLPAFADAEIAVNPVGG